MTFSRSFIIKTPPNFVFVSRRRIFSCLKRGPERQPPHELDGNELASSNLRGRSLLDHRSDLVHGAVWKNVGGGNREDRHQNSARSHGGENDWQFSVQSRR